MAVVDEILNALADGRVAAAKPGGGDAGTSVWVADYKKDFAWLWDLEADPRAGTGDGFDRWIRSNKDRATVLVLVWQAGDGLERGTGMPDCEPPFIAHHITPFDWVLSESYSLLESCNDSAGEAPPELRVIVVDLASHQLHGLGVFGVDMVEALKLAMPWFRVVSSSEYQEFLGGLRIGTWVTTRTAIHSTEDAVAQEWPYLALRAIAHRNLVNNLKMAWQGVASQAGDHHAISNLLGPMVLNQAFEATAPKDPVRHAVLKLVERYGLCPKPMQEVLVRRSDIFNGLAAELDGGSRLKVVLVDDKANDGWNEVVANLCGAALTGKSAQADRLAYVAKSADVDVWATTSYTGLLARLGNLRSVYDHRFALTFATQPGPEVLLIDLRLFGTDAARSELNAFRLAIKLAGHLGEQKALSQRLPSDRLAKLTKKVARWQKQGDASWRNDEDYLELLTLAPRVIAEMDFSLPIILFSSTRQRLIAELFRDYPNIITTFEKPQLFGYAQEDMVQETSQKFYVAVEKAIAYLRGRATVQRIKQLAVKAEERRKPRSKAMKSRPYIEVLIEESGDETTETFVVGGLALAFENEDKANELELVLASNPPQSRINIKTLLAGATIDSSYAPRWNGPDKLPKRLSAPRDPGKADAKEEQRLWMQASKQFKKLLSHQAKPVLGFAIATPARAVLKGFAPIGDQNLDNLYLHLLRRAADVLLYDLLSWYFPQGFEVKICAATRTRVKPSGEEFTKEEWAKLRRNYGITPAPDYRSRSGAKDLKRYTSMAPHSLVPVVFDIVSDRPKTLQATVDVTGAVCTQLHYGNQLQTTHQDFHRHAHYLADVMCYFMRYHENSYIGGQRVVNELCDFYVFDDDRYGLPEAQEASKRLDAGDRVSALASMRKALSPGAYDRVREAKSPNSVISVICSRVNAALEKMTADEFAAFLTTSS